MAWCAKRTTHTPIRAAKIVFAASTSVQYATHPTLHHMEKLKFHKEISLTEADKDKLPEAYLFGEHDDALHIHDAGNSHDPPHPASADPEITWRRPGARRRSHLFPAARQCPSNAACSTTASPSPPPFLTCPSLQSNCRPLRYKPHRAPCTLQLRHWRAVRRPPIYCRSVAPRDYLE